MQLALPERTFTLFPPARTLAGMTVYTTRWRNFRLLAGHPGGITEAADKLGKLQGQVSHFGGEKPIKNIGDKIAREIERAYKKPHGWLDRDHDSTVQPAELISPDHDVRQSYAERLDPTTLTYARDLIAMHYAAHGMAYSFFDDPEMLNFAYDYAADIADRRRLTAFTEALTNRVKQLGEKKGGQADGNAGGDGVLRRKGAGGRRA
jgi:hypothetical protein